MMPAERRLQLLALSYHYGFTIIEDDYDHEFHFSRSPVLPMASLDAAERIIYVGSLSRCWRRACASVTWWPSPPSSNAAPPTSC